MNIKTTAIITEKHYDKDGNLKSNKVIPKLITNLGVNLLATIAAAAGNLNINYFGLFTNDYTVATTTAATDLTTDADTWNAIIQSSSNNTASFRIVLYEADGDLNIDTYYGGSFWAGANATPETGTLFECYNSEREITAGDYLDISFELTFTAIN